MFQKNENTFIALATFTWYWGQSIVIFYSGGLTFGQKDQKDETVSGRFVESVNETGNGNNLLGSIKMEVVPPKSGLAEIDLKYEDQSIQVRPSTAFIRPLSLESSRHSINIRTVSILGYI